MPNSLVAAAQSANVRVLLTLTWTAITTATVVRVHADGTTWPVRNTEPIICAESTAFFDHEAPFDQAVTYRATSAQAVGTTLTSGAVTVASSGLAWLTHPGLPALNGVLAINDLSESYVQRQGVFQPIGSAVPIVVSDVGSGTSGTATVLGSTAAEMTRIRALLATGSVLLLRLPSTWSGDTWYVAVNQADQTRFTAVATDTWRRFALAYQQAARPTGLSAGAVGITCDDVPATYATCTLLTAAKATCTLLATSVV